MRSIHRSRSLMTGAPLLAVMTASAGGVRADTVIVQGSDGVAGADGVNPGDLGLPGGDGELVFPASLPVAGGSGTIDI